MLDRKLKSYVNKAMHGDTEAFIQICRYKGRELLYICISLLGNERDGEDAAQEIMTHMYKRIRDLKSEAAFPSWMYMITRNVCIDMRKRKYMKLELDAFEQIPAEIPEDKMDFMPAEYLKDEGKRKILIRVVKELPFDCMMAVMMFFFDGMSYREIGRAMNLNKKDIDNMLAKSKRLIRRRLEEQEEQKSILVQAGLPSSAFAELIREDIVKSVSIQQVEQLEIQFIESLPEAVSAELVKSRKLKKGNKMLLKSALPVMVGSAILAVFAGIRREGLLPEFTADVKGTEEYIIAAEEPEGTEEEVEIRTVEDMIGLEDAALLREFAAAENAEISQFYDFLSRIGFRLNESVWDMSREQEYRMYSYEKKDKRLTVILQVRPEDETGSLVFGFAGRSEDLPESFMIPLSYQAWRESR